MKKPITLMAGAGMAITNFRDKDQFEGDIKNTPSQFRVFAGYRLHMYVGVEAGYVNFGKTTYNGIWVGSSQPFNDEGDITASGVQISAMGFFPVARNFTLLAKAGGLAWWTTDKMTNPPSSQGFDASGISPLFGLGAELDIIEMLALRFEWEYYLEVGKKDKTGAGPIHAFSLDLILRLGNR
ncbi:MAG: outer membrane beta-barrel protein [Chlorobi bacterium]|nr:outer membrane beta-barrel protein [Chlorobiota bacterium]